MFSLLVIIHGLCAVALLGALTHQAISVLWPARQRTGSFVSSLRSVPSATYTNAIIGLFIATVIIGSIIYTEYRVSIRSTLRDYRLFAQEGSFELKEHFLSIGLGLLPAYWYYWRPAIAKEFTRTRVIVTALLAAIVWYAFIVGHVLNDIRGFGS